MRALDGMSITTAREALTAELTDKLLPHYLRDAKRWKLTYKRLMRFDERTFTLIFDKVCKSPISGKGDM